jgi:hypothetical protein
MSRKPNWLNRPYFFLGFISGAVVILLVLGILFSRYASLVSYAGVTQPKVAAEQTAGAQWVNYQGRLLEPASGAPKADGTYAITFSLYTLESGGTARWSETKDVVVTNGQFSTMLGSTTPFHLGLLNGQELWLGIQVGADPEAAPRQRIGHSIYALHSTNADLLDGLDSTRFALNNHNHDEAYVKKAGPDAMSGSTDAALLTVSNTGTGANSFGVYGSTASAANGVAGVRGSAGLPGVTITGAYGVLGQADAGTGVTGVSKDRFGVYGWSTNSFAIRGEGQNGGVFALSWSPGSYSIHGQNTATTGASYGVYGQSVSSTGRGVYGNASATSGINYGVFGQTSSVNGFAGYFSAPAGGTAGHFVGNVSVHGSLTKSSGTFKIDHPLDPENKYLYHSFVESPDMMNVYNGNATLDANGEVWINLPNYFEALNRDFRYQLTPIGGPAPNLHVAQEVQNNRFKIAGGGQGLRVSWQVTGIRHDPYAKANPVIVEVDKSAEERGVYLHPEVYGRDYSRGLNYRNNQRALDAASESGSLRMTDETQKPSANANLGQP